MEWLNGKKTIIGSLILSAAGLVWAIDQIAPGEWFTKDQYEAFAMMIGGLTGVAMRFGVAKSGPNPPTQ